MMIDKGHSAHNENRDRVRALYEFRKADPPLISGTELTKALTVGSSLPVSEATALFDRILAELGKEKNPRSRKAPASSSTGPVSTISN